MFKFWKRKWEKETAGHVMPYEQFKYKGAHFLRIGNPELNCVRCICLSSGESYKQSEIYNLPFEINVLRKLQEWELM